MSESPAARIRQRMNELRVGHIPIEPDVGPIRDYSPDAIGAHDLGRPGEIEIRDRQGNSWIGDAEAALEALMDLDPTGEPSMVWERLATVR